MELQELDWITETQSYLLCTIYENHCSHFRHFTLHRRIGNGLHGSAFIEITYLNERFPCGELISLTGGRGELGVCEDGII